MKISNVCKSYFSGFSEIRNYKKNDNKTNALAALKIFSYFTGVVPLGFAIASLCGRVCKKKASTTDQNVSNKAKNILNKDVAPNLKDKVDAYVKHFKSDYSEETIVDLSDFIHNVINNPTFQENPKKYLEDWKLRRGGSEEFRIIEDSALSFFENEFKS